MQFNIHEPLLNTQSLPKTVDYPMISASATTRVTKRSVLAIPSPTSPDLLVVLTLYGETLQRFPPEFMSHSSHFHCIPPVEICLYLNFLPIQLQLRLVNHATQNFEFSSASMFKNSYSKIRYSLMQHLGRKLNQPKMLQ